MTRAAGGAGSAPRIEPPERQVTLGSPSRIKSPDRQVALGPAPAPVALGFAPPKGRVAQAPRGVGAQPLPPAALEVCRDPKGFRWSS